MTTGAPAVVGRGLETGYLPEAEVRALARQGLDALPLDGRRVLVLIPDGTRTMPMPLLFDVLVSALGRRAAALDFLVALGTHQAMSDEQLSALVGLCAARRVGGPDGAARVVDGGRREPHRE